MFDRYADYYERFNQDKPYKKEIEFVYKWAKRPKSIFDIGAGTGNYWKFYPKGVDIFGVDKSPHMAHNKNNKVCADITTYKHPFREQYDCATALFDVLNYIPKHKWWKNLPIKKGGYFIFDIWDKNKIDKDGFRETVKNVNGVLRYIRPIMVSVKEVSLDISIYNGKNIFSETHRMYLYTHRDIELFCDREFEIVEVNPTKTWQTWYKLRRL